VEANTTANNVEEEDFGACVDGRMTKSNNEKRNTMLKTQSPKENMTNEDEEGTKLATPNIKMGSMM
jgi:hypothetical protein